MAEALKQDLQFGPNSLEVDAALVSRLLTEDCIGPAPVFRWTPRLPESVRSQRKPGYSVHDAPMASDARPSAEPSAPGKRCVHRRLTAHGLLSYQ